jgi:hypothetical protein
MAIPGEVRCSICKDKNIARNLALRAALKADVIQHYGGPTCACCLETFDLCFLSIDHVHGGGREHRKEIGGGGHKTYKWLKDHNYPDGFQVLCHNCNQAKGMRGECPHKQQQTELLKKLATIPLEY